jgi:CrcB protein
VNATTFLAVALGGALGASGRYVLSTALQRLLGDGFPWGTLGVNLLGSFLLGLLFAAVQREAIPPEFQGLLAVGVLGSFTTFSTFSLETLTLFHEGAWGRAIAYVLGSLLLGLAAVALGVSLAGGLRRT